MKQLLLRSACVVAFAAGVGSSAAYAQAASGPGVAQLGEVIVTASRRAENIQRSALAIQALSGRDLAAKGVYRPEDLNKLTPGVTFGTGADYPQIYVRGVGSFATNSLVDAAVATSIDGIIVSRPWQLPAAFFDLDRVEVVKGPQGTLYGRNATGGAINVITARPKINGGYTGFGEVEVGNYDLVRGTIGVNLPINDVLAARVSSQIVHRNGYLSEGADDDKSQAARLEVLYQPTDRFSVLLHSTYQHRGGVGAGATVTAPKVSDNPWQQNTDNPRVGEIYAASSPALAVPTPGTTFVNMTTFEVGGELKYDFGPATLTVVPGYRSGALRDANWDPGFGYKSNELEHQTTLEARLSGNGQGPLKWVVGAYYFNEHQQNPHGEDNIDIFVFKGPVPTTAVTDFTATSRSYAIFGQGTYSLTDRLRLTLGARYTDEKKNLDEILPGAITIFQVDEHTWTNLSWKAGFEYDVAPKSMAFFNASTGFKSGGFYGAPAPFGVYAPEKLLAFEAGSKNRFFDDTLQLNAEAFYWKYRDQQLPAFELVGSPPIFTQATLNAGKAHMAGVDVAVVYRLSPNDTIESQVEWIKTNYDTFLLPVSFLTLTACPIINNGQQVNCAGRPLVRTPDWSGTMGYTHSFDLAGGAKVDANLSTQFASGTYLENDYLPEEWQKAYSIWDAALTYHTPDRKIAVTGYVRNFTNSFVAGTVNRHTFIPPGDPLASANGVFTSTVRPPRTFGAMVHVDF